MDINPYEILGVAEDADDAVIKAAYRRLAKERHPDTPNGSTEAFADLEAAYDTLRDPTKRAIFDATGKIDAEIDEVDQRAVTMIIGCIAALSEDAMISALADDVVGYVVSYFKKEVSLFPGRISGLRSKVDRFERMSKRIKKKDGKIGTLNIALASVTRQAKKDLADVELSAKASQRAIEMLVDYEYASDQDINSVLKRLFAPI